MLKLLNVELLFGVNKSVNGAIVWCQHDIVLNIDLSYGALVPWVMLTAVHYQVEVSILPNT